MQEKISKFSREAYISIGCTVFLVLTLFLQSRINTSAAQGVNFTIKSILMVLMTLSIAFGVVFSIRAIRRQEPINKITGILCLITIILSFII